MSTATLEKTTATRDDIKSYILDVLRAARQPLSEFEVFSGVKIYKEDLHVTIYRVSHCLMEMRVAGEIGYRLETQDERKIRLGNRRTSPIPGFLYSSNLNVPARTEEVAIVGVLLGDGGREAAVEAARKPKTKARRTRARNARERLVSPQRQMTSESAVSQLTSTVLDRVVEEIVNERTQAIRVERDAAVAELAALKKKLATFIA